MLRGKEIIIGCRQSRLAQMQADLAIGEFQKKFPVVRFIKKLIESEGDRNQESVRPVVGAFIKTLEEALLGGEIDIAIHSAKDLPTAIPTGLAISPIGQREDHRDCFVSANDQKMADLKNGQIGTSSPRRIAQLHHAFPNLKIVPMQGNIETRLKKIKSEKLAGIVLAVAGLKRLGLGKLITEYLPFLPAGGQGSLALEYRESDQTATELAMAIAHQPTVMTVTAEREFLRLTQAGCRTPLGVLGEWQDGRLILQAEFFSSNGKLIQKDKEIGDNPLTVADKLAKKFKGYLPELAEE